MTVHLSAAEFRRLALAGDLGLPVAPAKVRTTRKTAPRGGAITVCHDCGERFETDAGETRHVETTHHARYQLELSSTTS